MAGLPPVEARRLKMPLPPSAQPNNLSAPGSGVDTLSCQLSVMSDSRTQGGRTRRKCVERAKRKGSYIPRNSINFRSASSPMRGRKPTAINLALKFSS